MLGVPTLQMLRTNVRCRTVGNDKSPTCKHRASASPLLSCCTPAAPATSCTIARCLAVKVVGSCTWHVLLPAPSSCLRLGPISSANVSAAPALAARFSDLLCSRSACKLRLRPFLAAEQRVTGVAGLHHAAPDHLPAAAILQAKSAQAAGAVSKQRMIGCSTDCDVRS